MKGVSSLLESGAIEQGRSLGPLTTYKTGGPARFYAKPQNVGELQDLADLVASSEISVLVIGRGSNLLVADRGFDGLVIHMAEGFNDLNHIGLTVEAGAGSPLPRLARYSVEVGIAGLEFFVGVPGSVGGAVRQNAGCFGVETRDRLKSACVFDLRSGVLGDVNPEELGMAYRHSNLHPDQVIVSAVFVGTSSDVTSSGDKLKEITRWRKENQPGGTLNAGSVFKNPVELPAGKLIEDCGLKGFSIGHVAVSAKHANFFVADRGASSEDIRDLISEVRRIVLEQTGVELQPEIQLVGFDDDD